MKDDVLVSIIVPVYNAENFLTQCIESILSQTYNNIEVLLVNDGSQDRSGKICEDYAARDLRIKTIHQKNMGPSVARNTGISHSKGVFLQFVDADDRLDSLMTEELVSHKTGVDLVICGYKSIVNIDGNNIIKEIYPSKKERCSMDEFMQIFSVLFKQSLINSPCNKLYDASIVHGNKLRFDAGTQHGEDLLFNINYFNFCKQVKLLNKPLYFYIKNNNDSSLTKKHKENFFENRLNILEELNKLITKYQDIAPQNERLLKEVSGNYLLQSLSNIYHDDITLSWERRKKEVSCIIKSNWVRKNIENYIVNAPQDKLIIFLVKHQATIGINLYFLTKILLRRNAKIPYKFLKKLN